MNNSVNNNLNKDVSQVNIETVAPNIPAEHPRTMKFDPMTGEPITPVEPIAPVEPVGPTTAANEQLTSNPVQNVNTQIPEQNTDISNNANDAVQIQNELQNIPTVGQGKEEFINNVQSMQQEKKEEKKEGVNFVFIIILFVVILAAILFLFPFLLDYI